MEGIKKDGKKAKLRTSKDIYNRLKWDFDSISGIDDIQLIYIGYKDRFMGMCELPFAEFSPLQSHHNNFTDDDKNYDDEDDEEGGSSSSGGGGDIPYHRIYYFRGGGPPLFPLVGKEGEIRVRPENLPPHAVFYWDRESRIDRIFNSGENSQTLQKVVNNNNPSSSKPSYSNLPSYKFNTSSGVWEAVTDITSTTSTSNFSEFTLLSFNILFDLYPFPLEIVPCSQRWPHLLDFLQSSNADIIALQEVTKTFILLLEGQEWVQENYFLTELSTGIGQHQTISPYGQLFLSKIPPSRVLFTELVKKRVIIASFNLKSSSSEKLVHIANVHLSSDFKGDASSTRRKQIKQLVATLSNLEQSSDDVIIVGDTNFGGQESIMDLGLLDVDLELVDVWEKLKQQNEIDPGYTFDIQNNPLASAQSKKGTCERYDRIFVKASNSFKPAKIQIVGKDPVHFNIWLSDHYGLECKFRLNTPSIPSNFLPNAKLEQRQKLAEPLQMNLSPVFSSAVVIIPPEHLWPLIQNIRSKLDPSYARWPPHITLFFKFIPDTGSNFQTAADQVKSALDQIQMQPFQISFEKLGIFNHSKSCSVYLAPNQENGDQISAIFNSLAKLFPSCATDKDDGRVYTPHLTLAKLPTESDTNLRINENLMQKWKKQLFTSNPIPLTFTVDRIYFISRNPNLDTPFRIRKSIFLGNNYASKHADLQTFLELHQLCPDISRKDSYPKIIQAELEQIISSLFGIDNFSLHLTGSTLLGVQDVDSDLDFICVGPSHLSPSDFFKRLESGFSHEKRGYSFSPSFQLKSIVLDTTIPIARLSWKNYDIDLVYLNYSCSHPLEISHREIEGMTDSQVRTLNAVREGHKILEIISSHLKNSSDYAIAVRCIKYWARQRNIYHKRFGLLGSNQISLLVAYIIVSYSGGLDSAEEIVAKFFEIFANWKWLSSCPVQFHELKHEDGQKNNKIGKKPGKVPELKIRPILSPVFPYLNRNLNITKSTRLAIQKELQRADEILGNVLPLDDFSSKWEKLVKVNKFFNNSFYEKYCKVLICSKSQSDAEIANGILQRKMLTLIIDLEQSCGLVVVPYNNISINQSNDKEQTEILAFLGINGTFDLKKVEDVMKTFEKKFKTWTNTYCKEEGMVKIQLSIEVDGI